MTTTKAFRRYRAAPLFAGVASVAIAAAPATGVAGAAIAPPMGPVQQIVHEPVAEPVDHPFAGTIAVEIDARDIAHKVFVVRERIPVQRPGRMTLLYPRWEAASHGPSLTVTDIAGLTVEADGRPVRWRRDAIEPHAFHLDLPAGARMIQAEYQLIAGEDELSPDVVVVPWLRLMLYPAGWYARNLPVAARVTFPSGLQPFSSLAASAARDDATHFAPVSLETLFDSPVYAARYVRRTPLSSDHGAAVTLDLIASRADDLRVAPERIEPLRRMISQARALFGPEPFGRYTFLARMRDDGSAGGTEHRGSSEVSLPSNYFAGWAEQLNNRDIFAHEFSHAWNGLYRTPADLWAPTPNVPQGGSLLWVYEGQTEFWGRVLAARAGLRSREETLDRLALDAAEAANRPGRAWRPLADDVNYPSFMLHQRVPWRDWQRRKDYYGEGVLLWLAIDARLRARSGGRRGLDDFAHGFFAGASAAAPARTYTFETLCAALGTVAPGDWAADLRRWIEGHQELDTNIGLEQHGWRLVYTATPTATFRQSEAERGVIDLSYAIGLAASDGGSVANVAWGGPAYRAGLAPGAKIVAIAGSPFSRDRLIAAVRGADTNPIRLTVAQDGVQSERIIEYRGSLRYPKLERLPGTRDGLAALLAPR